MRSYLLQLAEVAQWDGVKRVRLLDRGGGASSFLEHKVFGVKQLAEVAQW